MTLAKRVTKIESNIVTNTVTVKTVEILSDTNDYKIIWINNSNSSCSPIKLLFKDNQYFGPRGERYNSLPTQRQLEKVYAF